MDQTVKNMAMNILFRESLDSNKLLKDFFIVDAEGRRDGRFNMQNTIDYISAYMPFEMYWSIRVKHETFLATAWTDVGDDQGCFTRELLTKYCGLPQEYRDDDEKVREKLLELVGQ